MIKKVELNDCSDVAELACRMWDSHDILELKNEFELKLDKDDFALFIKVIDEKIVGFCECSLRYDYVEGTSSSPVGYLEGIFVLEEYRNLGIASSLLAESEMWAKKKGCTEFASDCELENNDSLKFHLKAGFKEANRIICFKKDL